MEPGCEHRTIGSKTQFPFLQHMSPHRMTRACHMAGEVAHQLKILVVIEEYWVWLPAPI